MFVSLNIEALIKGSSQEILSSTKDCFAYLKILADKLRRFQGFTSFSNTFAVAPLERDPFQKTALGTKRQPEEPS